MRSQCGYLYNFLTNIMNLKHAKQIMEYNSWKINLHFHTSNNTSMQPTYQVINIPLLALIYSSIEITGGVNKIYFWNKHSTYKSNL